MGGNPQQDLVLSGGLGLTSSSARAGFLPISLERVPLEALQGINVHLRASGAEKKEAFVLFRGSSVPFTEEHRKRLTGAGVKFIYIAMSEQDRFRKQTEANLLDTAGDPSTAVSARAEIVYETSVELVNELLSEPDLAAKSPRLEKVSRAVTTLVLSDPTAFSHLFSASHHDFYTATHMVNVGTWMVPLAYALGHHDVDELSRICQAGFLHDIGKNYIPADVLNKRGKLSDEEWQLIRRHPELGVEHLSKYDGIHPTILAVTLEHHERMDGSGYPRKLKGDQMDPISRICAVVDSFDAMTAFRPFKERTMSVADAVKIIVSETPLKYDKTVVDAWVGLLKTADKLADDPTESSPGRNQRNFERLRTNCPARLHLMEWQADGWRERPGIPLTAHNISRSGLGMLSQKPVQINENVRVYLIGGKQGHFVEGVIVRNREYRDGWFELGMKFASLASETELQTITALTAAA